MADTTNNSTPRDMNTSGPEPQIRGHSTVDRDLYRANGDMSDTNGLTGGDCMEAVESITGA